MPYTLVTANRNYSSWSLRPWLLMKALDIPFDDRIEPFAAASNYDAFRRFSPTGLVPALLDGERTIPDSLAITMYLADRHPGIWPDGTDARVWAQCAVAEMHAGFSALRSECPMNVGVRIRLHAPSPALQRDLDRLRELWTDGLARFGGPWLAGNRFSAVDAFFAPVAWRTRTYALELGPQAQTWVDHVIAHPAMQDWEQQALHETWRETAHEADMLASGSLIADHRR